MTGLRALTLAYRSRFARRRCERFLARADELLDRAQRLKTTADRLDAEANVELLARRARDGPS